MTIILELDIMMAKRKISSKELAERLDLTESNLSILKNNKSKGIKWQTLDKLCDILECEPGDLIKYQHF